MKMKTQVMDWLSQDKHLQKLFVPVILAWPTLYLFLWVVGLGSAKRRFTPLGALNLTFTAVIVLSTIVGFVEARATSGPGYWCCRAIRCDDRYSACHGRHTVDTLRLARGQLRHV
jgi:hypothetical protein